MRQRERERRTRGSERDKKWKYTVDQECNMTSTESKKSKGSNRQNKVRIKEHLFTYGVAFVCCVPHGTLGVIYRKEKR